MWFFLSTQNVVNCNILARDHKVKPDFRWQKAYQRIPLILVNQQSNLELPLDRHDKSITSYVDGASATQLQITLSSVPAAFRCYRLVSTLPVQNAATHVSVYSDTANIQPLIFYNKVLQNWLLHSAVICLLFTLLVYNFQTQKERGAQPSVEAASGRWHRPTENWNCI